MSEELFDVVFYGILRPGKDRETAMQNMAKLFKTDATRLAPYFAGGRKVIKGKVDAATAEKYHSLLENVGLVIKIEPCEDGNDNTTNAGHSKNAISSQQPATAEPAQQKPEPEAVKMAETSGMTVAPPGADVLEKPTVVQPQAIGDISHITLAEAGADIIENPAAKDIQEIGDISHITMAEAGSDILDSTRQESKANIPDISNLSLSKNES